MGVFPILGAIDAGSNAVRVLIAQSLPDGGFEPIYSDRVPVRLGRGTFTKGSIDSTTIDAAITAFARFKKLFVDHDVKNYRAVATSALRNASNRENLIDRCFRELKLEIEVINGREEAKLVKNAVADSLGKHTPDMIMDLGGGSLEILTPRSRGRWGAKSLKIGTVRLLESFEIKGEISESESKMIRRYVKTMLKQTLPEEDREHETNVAAICGGNAEALGEWFGEPNKHDVDVISINRLQKGMAEISSLSVEERMEEYGFRKDRAEVIGIAGLIFTTIAKELDLDELVVPRVGLREGVVLSITDSTRSKNKQDKEPQIYWSARSFAERLGHNLTHGEMIKNISTQLFKDLALWHELPDEYEQILGVAALLHDVGEVVHRKGHHKHSEYLISTGRMPGMGENDQRLAAAIARGHRGRQPEADKHDIFGSLSGKEQKAVEVLAAILRIADCFDTDHRQSVRQVTTEIKNKKIIFHVVTKRKSSLTEETLKRKSGYLSELIDKKIEFELGTIIRSKNNS